jgi:hypothetical protein
MAMYLRFGLDTEALSAAEWQLYSLSWTAEAVAKHLRWWSGQITESLSTASCRALQSERRLLPKDWDFLATLAQSKAQAGESG